MDKLRDKIRTKFPGWAKQAGARPAIRLFCIECMGGSYRDATTCETTDCFLWPFGLAARAQRLAAGDCPQRPTAQGTADLASDGQK